MGKGTDLALETNGKRYKTPCRGQVPRLWSRSNCGDGRRLRLLCRHVARRQEMRIQNFSQDTRCGHHCTARGPSHHGRTDRRVAYAQRHRVLRTSKGYACEYSLQKSPLCRFHVTGFIHGRKINEEEMEDFLEGKTGVLDGFTTADGKMFSSVLTFRDNGLVGLDPRITTCPSCGGNILVSPVAYNCSNYGNQEHPCRFFLWRNIAGHEVTAEEMRQICEEGATRSPIDFYKHNGVIFRQRLALNADRTKVIKQ